jgi:HEAT repeat protein
MKLPKRIFAGMVVLTACIACADAAVGAAASYQGKPASYWLDEFDSPTNNSIAAFKAMGSNAVPFLIKVLETKSSKLGEIADTARSKYSQQIPPIVEKSMPSAYRMQARREEAAYLIEQIGPEAEAAIPTLLKVFTDQTEDSRVSQGARSALMAMGEKAATLVPIYLSWLKNTNVDVQIEGAVFLGSVGPKAKSAVPELLQAADSNDLQLRWSAAWALWRIDRHTNVALRVFSPGLECTNDLRLSAFGRFREMGPAARPVAQKIAVALRDEDEQVREAAVRALKEIDPALLESRLREMNLRTTENVAHLIEMIRTGDHPRRYRAIEAIALFGPGAKDAVAALIEAIDEPRSQWPGRDNLWMVTADALGEIGPDASAAVTNLIELTQKSKQYAAMSYCPALGKIGKNASPAVPMLQSLLQDENLRTRLAAADALTKITPQSCSNVVAVLTNLLNKPELAPYLIVGTDGVVRPSDSGGIQNPESVFFRLSVGVALWRLGLETEPPTDALANLAAKDPSSGGELWPIKLLGDIGPTAKPALPTLRRVLERNSTLYSRAAAISIRHIDPDEFDRLGLPGMLGLP